MPQPEKPERREIVYQKRDNWPLRANIERLSNSEGTCEMTQLSEIKTIRGMQYVVQAIDVPAAPPEPPDWAGFCLLLVGLAAPIAIGWAIYASLGAP